jgi:CHAT domain-containing protein
MQKITNLTLLSALACFAFSCGQKTSAPLPISKAAATRSATDSTVLRADAYLDALRYDSASILFQFAENQYHNDVDFTKRIACVRKRAHCLWGLHESEQAAALCSSALSELSAHADTLHPEAAKLYTILGNIHADKRTQTDFLKSVDYYNHALNITRKNAGDPSPELAGPIERLGMTHWLIDDPKSAIAYFEKALRYLDTLSESSAPMYAKISNNTGMAYFSLGQYQKAYEAFDRARRIVTDRLQARDSRVAKYLKNMAEAKCNLGDANEAETLLKEALDLETATGAPKSKLKNYILEGLAGCADAKGNYQEAIALYRECLAYWRPGNRDDLGGLCSQLQMLGDALQQDGQSTEAINCLQRAYAMIDSNYDAGSLSRVSALYSLGRAFARIHERAKAEHYFKQALRIAQAAYGDQHPKLGDIKKELAQLAFASGKQAEALRWAKSAHTSYVEQGSWAIGTAPAYAVNNLSDYIGLLDLFGQIEIAGAGENRHNTFINKGLWYFKQALNYSDILKKNRVSDSDRQLVQKQIAAVSGHAIDALYIGYTQQPDAACLENLCFYMEKSKAAELLSASFEKTGKRRAGVPAALLEQEQNLKNNLLYKQNLLYDPSFLELAPEKKDKNALRTHLAETRIALAQLVDSLERAYPVYQKTQSNSALASIKDLQDFVQKNNYRLLEYTYGEQAIDLLYIEPNAARWLRIPITTALIARLDSLDAVFHEAQPERQSDAAKRQAFQSFCNSAAYLYDALLKPVLEGQNPCRQLLIIPDGPLSRMPFQALLTAAPIYADCNYRNLPYLVRDYAIQYECSGSLLLAVQETSATGPYLGFAPDYTSAKDNPAMLSNTTLPDSGYRVPERGDWAPLHYNTSEVATTAKLMNGGYFTGSAATEARFKKHAPEAGVLHLAMHAAVNNRQPDYSSMVFATDQTQGEDGNLFTFELSNLNLNADLAVLSACNTGAGKWEQGEGVMSLARAFQYAGCRSIMMSLWEANDAVTRDLTVHFFQELVHGAGKNEALRTAALQHLYETTNETYCHPHYWANFVLIGPASALSFHKDNKSVWAVWCAGIAISALVLGMLLYLGISFSRLSA